MPRRKKQLDTAQEIDALRTKYAGVMDPSEIEEIYYSNGCSAEAVAMMVAARSVPQPEASPAPVEHFDVESTYQIDALDAKAATSFIESIFPGASQDEVFTALSRGNSVTDVVEAMLSSEGTLLELDGAFRNAACIDLMCSVFPDLPVAVIKQALTESNWETDRAAAKLSDGAFEARSGVSGAEVYDQSAAHDEMMTTATHMAMLSQLQEMFPDLLPELCHEELVKHNWDLDVTIDTLAGLQFSLTELCNMFPAMEPATLSLILELCHSNVAEAVDKLLAQPDANILVQQLMDGESIEDSTRVASSKQPKQGRDSKQTSSQKGRKRHQKLIPVPVSLSAASQWAPPDQRSQVSPLSAKLRGKMFGQLRSEFAYLKDEVFEEIVLAAGGNLDKARGILTAIAHGTASLEPEVLPQVTPPVPRDWVYVAPPPVQKLQGKALPQAELYSDARSSAAYHALRRSVFFREAARAFASGHGDMAREFANRGHEQTRLMQEANARSAELIFSERNAHLDFHTIDLHGLHVDEAMIVLARRISEAKAKQIPALHVITGAGRHSAGGVPRIKRAVIAFLTAAQINFRIPENQDGALYVLLSSRRNVQ